VTQERSMKDGRGDPGKCFMCKDGYGYPGTDERLGSIALTMQLWSQGLIRNAHWV
jgi:hypothetical protein